jgi:hypothetical protein
MEVEEPQDWVDGVLARDGMWEPPAHFADRLAAQAMQVLPARRASLIRLLPELALGAGRALAARVDVSLWVLRQYRALLFS